MLCATPTEASFSPRAADDHHLELRSVKEKKTGRVCLPRNVWGGIAGTLDRSRLRPRRLGENYL